MPIRTKKFKAEICSTDRPGEVCAVSEVKGWEKVRVQVDSGPVDAVGPKEIAEAPTIKENAMWKKGLGYVAANGSKIRNYGEKRSVGYTESGDGVSTKVQCADVEKVLVDQETRWRWTATRATCRARRQGRRP